MRDPTDCVELGELNWDGVAADESVAGGLLDCVVVTCGLAEPDTDAVVLTVSVGIADMV